VGGRGKIGRGSVKHQNSYYMRVWYHGRFDKTTEILLKSQFVVL